MTAETTPRYRRTSRLSCASRLTQRPARLAGHSPRHRTRRDLGRRRNLHQDGLARRCDFDSALLESPLHAAVEFALHRPAAAVGAANLTDDRGHDAVDLVDAPQFEIAADRMPVFGLPAHLSDDILEDLAGAVGVFPISHVDAD